MPFSSFIRSSVKGIVTAVPENIRSIDEETDNYGGNVAQLDRIKKVIGIDKRRVVDTKTTAADLCLHAAEYLMKSLDIDRNLLGAIVCVTQTPDYWQPCNAAVLHGRMGLSKDCAAFDVNLGCSGYVYGLWLLSMMIETGFCDKVLLLAGDTISRCVHKNDRSVAPLFGDAGSATLIECANDSPSWYSLNTDGSGFDGLIIPAGGFRLPANSENAKAHQDADGNWRSLQNLRMNGSEIFNFSMREGPASVQRVLEYAKLKKEDMAYFFFHQANKYILGNIARRLNISLDKVPCGVVSEYGNQSSASIPGVICSTLSNGAFPEGNVLLSGLGVGLSWASAIMSLKGLETCKIVDFKCND